MKLNVQYESSSEEVIIGYFGARQDSKMYDNLGEVESSDMRWIYYYNSLPEWAQEMLPTPT